MKIRIGTRGSSLALIQTAYVENLLKTQYQDIQLERVVIKTKGDTDLQPLVDLAGEGFFTEALFNALMDDKIDLAVHSAKDLPTISHNDCEYYAVGEREDVTDTLLIKKDCNVNPVIGTSSIRRALQIKDFNPDATVKPIRGNIDSRIKKIKDGEYDGIVLASAGLNRSKLKLPDHLVQKPMDFVTAPGQGILAIQVKKSFKNNVAKIINCNLDKILKIEKAFLTYLGGGCHLPFGCNIKDHNLQIYFDGTKSKIKSLGAGFEYDNQSYYLNKKIKFESRGNNLEELFQKGVEGILEKDSNLAVWVTSPMQNQIQTSLKLNKTKAICFPLIKTKPMFKDEDLYSIQNDFDCVIFPSQTGIKLVKGVFKKHHVFCMGKSSQKLLEDFGYTDISIIDNLKDFKGHKVLLMSADHSLVADRLKQNNIPYIHFRLYKTESVIWNNLPYEPKSKDSIIFTSPSTVESFVENLKIHPLLSSLQKFSIGGTTLAKLNELGLEGQMVKHGSIDSLIELIESKA